MTARRQTLTRRRLLLSAGVLTLAGSTSEPAKAGTPLPSLTLWGPPAGPSIILVNAATTRLLRHVADRITFKAWRNPDEMRAGLTSGTMQVVVMPTQAAANLYNRGLGVRLLNTMTDGLLYFVSADASLTSIASLRGRKVGVPYRNDTPEFIANSLFRAAGLQSGRDMAVETTGSPIEAMQLLLAGRLDAALLPEPACSAAIVKGKLSGKTFQRVMDVQDLWAKIAPESKGILPQAGLAITAGFFEKHRDKVDPLQEALAEASRIVRATPAVAANGAASSLELPWPIIEQSIPWSRLECRRAIEARPYLESMFKTIAAADISLLGGKLPAAEFYL